MQQATLQGASREELIEEAMAELVTGNAADRIGVWLDRNRHQGSVADPSFHGLVWDRENETTPREWRVLAPQAVLPSARLIAASHAASIIP